MKKREIAGFTLIEAMVLVAVLGILAAIGIPNYSRYVTRGHLVEAGNALADYRTRMEEFYKGNSSYANAGACGQAVPTNLDTFAISCAVATGGQAFTATATGAGSTAGFVYTINHANARTTAAIPSHWGSLTRDARNTWVTR
jgi:type IV pilus assembly protein PilE